jgi:Nucleotidyltransferase domain
VGTGRQPLTLGRADRMRAISDPARFAAVVIWCYLPDPVYRIFLLGSRATGSAAAGSDIDIGIEGPSAVPWSVLAAIEDEIEEGRRSIRSTSSTSPASPTDQERRAAAGSVVSKARAIGRLEEALALPKDPIVRDPTIRDFV